MGDGNDEQGRPRSSLPKTWPRKYAKTPDECHHRERVTLPNGDTFNCETCGSYGRIIHSPSDRTVVNQIHLATLCDTGTLPDWENHAEGMLFSMCHKCAGIMEARALNKARADVAVPLEDDGRGCGPVFLGGCLLLATVFACGPAPAVVAPLCTAIVIDTSLEGVSEQWCPFMSHPQPCEPCPGGDEFDWTGARR